MVLFCLIVIAALAVCVMSVWRRAGAAPQPAARRAAEVIEEGFSHESIAYGRSVMDHPMLEREAAKLCEKIKTEIRNGNKIWYEIYGYPSYIRYIEDKSKEETLIDYYENQFPSEERREVKGHDRVLGVVWALQHLTLAKLRREMPEVAATNASVESESDGRVECNVYAIVRK